MYSRSQFSFEAWTNFFDLFNRSSRNSRGVHFSQAFPGSGGLSELSPEQKDYLDRLNSTQRFLIFLHLCSHCHQSVHPRVDPTRGQLVDFFSRYYQNISPTERDHLFQEAFTYYENHVSGDSQRRALQWRHYFRRYRSFGSLYQEFPMLLSEAFMVLSHSKHCHDTSLKEFLLQGTFSLYPSFFQKAFSAQDHSCFSLALCDLTGRIRRMNIGYDPFRSFIPLSFQKEAWISLMMRLSHGSHLFLNRWIKEYFHHPEWTAFDKKPRLFWKNLHPSWLLVKEFSDHQKSQIDLLSSFSQAGFSVQGDTPYARASTLPSSFFDHQPFFLHHLARIASTTQSSQQWSLLLLHFIRQGFNVNHLNSDRLNIFNALKAYDRLSYCSEELFSELLTRTRASAFDDIDLLLFSFKDTPIVQQTILENLYSRRPDLFAFPLTSMSDYDLWKQSFKQVMDCHPVSKTSLSSTEASPLSTVRRL